MIEIYPHFKAQPVDSDLNPDDLDLDSDLVFISKTHKNDVHRWRNA